MKEKRIYLEQAYRIDQRINCKMEQVSSLHSLATKATSTITDMPGSPTRNIHKMEDIIVKIVDLENEINDDIDKLVDLKCHPADYKLPLPSDCLGLNVGADTVPLRVTDSFPSYSGNLKGARHM